MHPPAAHSPACVDEGGCAADYVAVATTAVTCALICLGACFVVVKRRELEVNSKKVPLLLIQACASLMFISGSLMSRNVFRLKRTHFWESCYLWRVWVEGPLGFGLLVSCYIAQVYRLYYLFVSRRLPPLLYHLVFLLVLPWFAIAAVMHAASTVTNEPACTSALGWKLVLLGLHSAYPTILVLLAWRIRDVRFQFNEFKEILRCVIICAILIAVLAGLFIADRVVNKSNKNSAADSRILITGRFTTTMTANVAVLLLFWIPISRTCCGVLRRQKKRYEKFCSMGQALGVPHSGYVAPTLSFDSSMPLDSLLENLKFRESFSAFADSRLAGETVHFYIEVRELNKLHPSNTMQRIYFTEHIIDKYIKSGSPYEINISHQMRYEILSTKDLADPDLFKSAVSESLRLMQSNLVHEYWRSPFFDELKAESEAEGYDGLETIIFKDSASDNPFDRGFSGDLRNP